VVKKIALLFKYGFFAIFSATLQNYDLYLQYKITHLGLLVNQKITIALEYHFLQALLILRQIHLNHAYPKPDRLIGILAHKLDFMGALA